MWTKLLPKLLCVGTMDEVSMSTFFFLSRDLRRGEDRNKRGRRRRRGTRPDDVEEDALGHAGQEELHGADALLDTLAAHAACFSSFGVQREIGRKKSTEEKKEGGGGARRKVITEEGVRV